MYKRQFIAFLLVALLLSACLPPQTKVETSKTEFCGTLYLFLNSVKFLENTAQFSDATELQAQLGTVQMNFANLRASAAELEEVRSDALTTAVEQLTAAAEEIPDGTNVEEAYNQIKDELTSVASEAEALGINLKCETLLEPYGVQLGTPTP